jgi:2-oxoglutarate ferredoxin oxidoreductase subunit gamma
MEKRLLVAGSGGQGILFLGKLIAYAAMLGGKEVTWFPSYGAEMRGGTANCTVIISDEMIGSPVVRSIDVLIAMNEASCVRFSKKLQAGGILVCDDSVNGCGEDLPGVSIVRVPALQLSADLNSPLSANMVMAGAFARATGLLQLSAVVKALEEITPARMAKTLRLNIDIISKGFDSFGDSKG